MLNGTTSPRRQANGTGSTRGALAGGGSLTIRAVPPVAGTFGGENVAQVFGGAEGDATKQTATNTANIYDEQKKTTAVMKELSSNLAFN